MSHFRPALAILWALGLCLLTHNTAILQMPPEVTFGSAQFRLADVFGT